MSLRDKGLEKYIPLGKIKWSHFGNWYQNAFLGMRKWGNEEVIEVIEVIASSIFWFTSVKWKINHVLTQRCGQGVRSSVICKNWLLAISSITSISSTIHQVTAQATWTWALGISQISVSFFLELKSVFLFQYSCVRWVINSTLTHFKNQPFYTFREFGPIWEGRLISFLPSCWRWKYRSFHIFAGMLFFKPKQQFFLEILTFFTILVPGIGIINHLSLNLICLIFIQSCDYLPDERLSPNQR